MSAGTCWKCYGLGWVGNCDIDDGRMTGRDSCQTCAATGEVSAEQVLGELARIMAVVSGPKR